MANRAAYARRQIELLLDTFAVVDSFIWRAYYWEDNEARCSCIAQIQCKTSWTLRSHKTLIRFESNKGSSLIRSFRRHVCYPTAPTKGDHWNVIAMKWKAVDLHVFIVCVSIIFLYLLIRQTYQTRMCVVRACYSGCLMTSSGNICNHDRVPSIHSCKSHISANNKRITKSSASNIWLMIE